MNYYIWFIPLTFFSYCISAYISNQLNIHHTHKWFALSVLWGNFGIILWTIIAKISNNIIFDGMLFDVIMTLGFTIALICLGSGAGFTIHQWLGCAIILVGIIVMKI